MKIHYASHPNCNVISLTDPADALRLQLVSFLGIMWSSILCASLGIWFMYGGFAFQIGLIALGMLMTGLTLHRAILTARSQTSRDNFGHWVQRF